ncbi:hypothetical protein [Leptospira brenneri]|uniref:Uncharacterized protein n=1 Tax=Leptospira brenneri TaxID=2023182 RepID=A0A2M9Y0W5_9LEPT|nr:hypothetical protein [Leptospira brenneri]PJZ45149.1 hypothetical protein CH361_13040 [Leptospira brenneri]TGK94025.1 hypothetical protein EHQ30_11235 [Leptospira brenneri]
MTKFIILLILISMLISESYPESKKQKGQINFSEEKPIHPFYEKYGEDGNLNCSEKQNCMSNCAGNIFVFNNKDKNQVIPRQGCINECNRILCRQEVKK